MKMCACVCMQAGVISSEAMASGAGRLRQPLAHTQTALIATATTTPAAQVQYTAEYCCILYFHGPLSFF